MQITYNDCIKTLTGTPEQYAMYAYDIQGPGAVVRAVNDIRAGLTVRFAVCTRLDGSGDIPEIKETLVFSGAPGFACLRFCGENDNPMGPGSHTVHGCGTLDNRGDVADLDPLEMVANITQVLARKSDWYFRLA
jgi:hypothetical protein